MLFWYHGAVRRHYTVADSCARSSWGPLLTGGKELAIVPIDLVGKSAASGCFHIHSGNIPIPKQNYDVPSLWPSSVLESLSPSIAARPVAFPDGTNVQQVDWFFLPAE